VLTEVQVKGFLGRVASKIDDANFSKVRVSCPADAFRVACTLAFTVEWLGENLDKVLFIESDEPSFLRGVDS